MKLECSVQCNFFYYFVLIGSVTMVYLIIVNSNFNKFNGFVLSYITETTRNEYYVALISDRNIDQENTTCSFC